MTEKSLTNKKHGMAMLIFFLLLMAAAIVMVVIGAMRNIIAPHSSRHRYSLLYLDSHDGA